MCDRNTRPGWRIVTLTKNERVSTGGFLGEVEADDVRWLLARHEPGSDGLTAIVFQAPARSCHRTHAGRRTDDRPPG
jgi:hypothetical protein